MIHLILLIYTNFFFLLTTCDYIDTKPFHDESTFTSVVFNDNILYILSASPCTSNQSISLTFVNFNTNYIQHVQTIENVKDPIRLGPNAKTALVLKVHTFPISDPTRKFYRDSRLHVMLYLVNITNYEKSMFENMSDKILMQPYFPMFHDQCEGNRNISWGFRPQTKVCDNSLRIGEYATLCWVKTRKDKLPSAVYLTLFDGCTTPYSTNIYVFRKDMTPFRASYTKDKLDKRLMFTASNDGCGLHMIMHHHHTVDYHIQLMFGCLSDTSRDITLIDDNYHTEFGFICPLSNCTTDKKNAMNQSCYVPWIDKSVGKTIVHFESQLDICTNSVTLYIYSKTFMFHQKMLLHADHKEDLHDQGMAFELHLKSPFGPQCNNSIANGYLCLDLGLISLYLHEEQDIGLVQVIILRHYPSPTDAFPIMNTEYFVDRNQTCPKKSESNWKSILVGVFVVLLLIIMVTFAVFCWRRRKQKRAGLGLPYEIHLGEQEMDDVDY